MDLFSSITTEGDALLLFCTFVAVGVLPEVPELPELDPAAKGE